MKLPRFRLMALFIAVAVIALPLGWLQVRRLDLKHQLAQLEAEGCKVSYEDNGLWITAPQVEVAMGVDRNGGLLIGAQNVSPEEASDRFFELQDQLRLIAVADKTIRMVTTDERNGQKSEVTMFVGEEEPPRMSFNTAPRSGWQQRRAQRKKAATTQPQNAADKE